MEIIIRQIRCNYIIRDNDINDKTSNLVGTLFSSMQIL